MITFWRIINTGFRNLFRHAWLSAAATAIMVVTLVVVSFSIFAALFLRNGLNTIKDRLDISVYLTDSVTTEQVKDLQSKLLAVPNVKGVDYLSKDEVLKQYETSPDESKRQIAAAAREAGGGLQATLQIKAKNLDDVESINQVLSSDVIKPMINSSSVDSNNSRRSNIEKIGKATKYTARVGAVVSVAFLIIALLIIFNTIRMAIFTRREEIEIMKLVGATKWFVRGPFIIEGALYGVLGATVAVLIIFPMLSALKPSLVKAVESDSVLNFITDRTLQILLAEYLIGILIGAISSWLAISRHLKI